MKEICAWCKKQLGVKCAACSPGHPVAGDSNGYRCLTPSCKEFNVVHGHDFGGCTHGICDACRERLERQDEARLRELEGRCGCSDDIEEEATP
jgi:hypothetical protein